MSYTVVYSKSNPLKRLCECAFRTNPEQYPSTQKPEWLKLLGNISRRHSFKKLKLLRSKHEKQLKQNKTKDSSKTDVQLDILQD